MTQTIKITDCDVVFLSYDEPNADQNYNQLLSFIPWAERVHGVKGSDAAHKACAKLATTERLMLDGIVPWRAGTIVTKVKTFHRSISFKPSGVVIDAGCTYGTLLN